MPIIVDKELYDLVKHKGDKNLKPFMKGSGINQFSDPKVVYEKAKKN